METSLYLRVRSAHHQLTTTQVDSSPFLCRRFARMDILFHSYYTFRTQKASIGGLCHLEGALNYPLCFSACWFRVLTQLM